MKRKKIDLKMLLSEPPWDWPEDTGEQLLAILRDDKAPHAERLLAADLAGNHTVLDDALAKQLLSLAGNEKETEEMRITAALSLGPILEHADLMGFDDPDDILVSEDTFEEIRDTLERLFADTRLPVDLRRRILEASVRSPLGWHEDAIRTAYASSALDWRITAVFCMRFVRGFDAQILESLNDRNPAIHCEAILAAGTWGIDAAWPHVVALIESEKTDKPLLLAAIEAASNIRPKEVPLILGPLEESDDEDIAVAVAEALDVAELGDSDGEDDDLFDEDDEDDEDDDDDDEDGDGDDEPGKNRPLN
jgi:hypothetical protein